MTAHNVYAKRAFAAFRRRDWPPDRWQVVEADDPVPVLFAGDATTSLLAGDPMPATNALVTCRPDLFQAVAGGRR